MQIMTEKNNMKRIIRCHALFSTLFLVFAGLSFSSCAGYPGIMNEQLDYSYELYDAGVKSYESGQFEESIDQFAKAINLYNETIVECESYSRCIKPDDNSKARVQFYTARGFAYLVIGQLDLAIKDAKTALTYNHYYQNPLPHNLLSRAYMHKGERKSAWEEYKKVAENKNAKKESANELYNYLSLYQKTADEGEAGPELTISMIRGKITVTKAGASESKTGIMAGDTILKIGALPTKNLTIYDALVLIKGAKGTKLQLTVMRDEWQMPRDFVLTRGSAGLGKEAPPAFLQLWKSMDEPKDEVKNAYYDIGVEYANKGEYDNAIASFTLAIKTNPQNAAAYHHRGIAYNGKGEYDLAIKDYSKVIELTPNDVNAYLSRGNAYCFKNQHDQAIKDYTKAIELKPDYADAFNNRGYAYHIKSQNELAIKDFSRAIELNPDYALAYKNRGRAYNAKNEYDLAIKDFSKTLELKPDDTGAYLDRGFAYFKKNQHAKSIEDYKKAAKLGDKAAQDYLKSQKIEW